jgi:ABC-type uncharacterized transport system substrate-binding protein
MLGIDIYKYFVLLLFLSFSVCFSSANASTMAGNRILLLHSYHPSFPTSSKILEGIRAGFEEDIPVINVEYMDSKRLHNATSQENFLNFLRYKLSNRARYDIVITTDDNALEFARNHRDELFPQVPIVFLGVNDATKAMSLSSSPWITGVVETISFADTISLARQLFPQRKNIQILVDGTTSGQADLVTIRGLKSQLPNTNFQEIDLTKHSWQGLVNKISSLGKSDSLLLVSAYRDQHGEAKSFSESLSLLTQHSKTPIFHMWEHGIGEGVFGGIVVSHWEQGKQAALMAKRILSGEPVSNIEVVQKTPNTPTFDAWQLSRFGIQQSQLPPNSHIKFQPITFWDRYWLEIVLTLTLFLFLLLILCFSNGVSLIMLRVPYVLRFEISPHNLLIC